MNKKMMLDDVASKNNFQIPSLEEMKKKDPEKSSGITVILPNYKIIQLLEISILLYQDLEYVNGIISNAIDDFCIKIREQHHVTSLTFDGKEIIRSDVLLKLKSISEYFETFSTFPVLKTQAIKASLDTILGQVVSRTKRKYLTCIKTWLKKAKGQELYYHSEVDLSGFKQAILKKLVKIE